MKKYCYYQYLQYWRKNANLTQMQVAIELNTTPNQLSRYENGTRELPIGKAVILCKLYNVTLDQLYLGKGVE